MIDDLVQRAEFEATLLARPSPLQAPKAAEPTSVSEEGASSAGKKGKSKSPATKKKKSKGRGRTKPPLSIRAQSAGALLQDGVVRLDGVLRPSTAALLRAEIIEHRAAAFAAVESGDDWRLYFADVLLKTDRCDLLLPLRGNRGVQMALRECLVGDSGGGGGGGGSGGGGGGSSSTPLHGLLSSTLGEDASLYELSALLSEAGAPRQPVHPDNPHQEHAPLLTCFIALQDVTAAMGPTVFLPGTHTAEAHAEYGAGVASRDALLSRSRHVVALLGAGDASLFDSRTLHCGGANTREGGGTRALFYCSFRNPRAGMPVGNVGSLHPSVKPISLRELRVKLAELCVDDETFDPFDESREQAAALARYRAAAEGEGEEEGGGASAAAQFNLAMCYRRGEGVSKDDAQALRWFLRAAGQGLALGQTQVGFSYYLGEGVAKDEAEAARWFGLAAAQGEANAQHNLGICFGRGVGVAKDIARADELLERAEQQGHPGAAAARQELAQESTSEAP